MVQDISNSSDENSTPQLPETAAKGIPVGNYRLVGWAVDTTGRRLIDEIVQIAGYTDDSKFSQYIMPFADLNPVYSRKHNIRVFNTIRYRRLKDMKTGQFLKTKSEISALTDFLQWLETLQGDTDGIILVFHEIRKSTPGMLLEAMRRNSLLERFQNICKGFANTYYIAKSKCQSCINTHNLRILGKLLLGRDNLDCSTAVARASATFDVTTHLAKEAEVKKEGEPNQTTPIDPQTQLMELVCPFVCSISCEDEEIQRFKVLLQRQNTFRPVFGALMRGDPSERQHASHLRRLLALNNVNYDKLREAYETGAKDALDKILKDEISNAKEADLTELLDILDRFFDPEKKPVKPKQIWYRYANWRPRSFNKNRRRSNSRSKKISESKGDDSTGENNSSPEKKASEEIITQINHSEVPAN